MSTLALHMTLAWMQRRVAGGQELAHARRAPALFKPERVLQLAKDVDRAGAETERWGS